MESLSEAFDLAQWSNGWQWQDVSMEPIVYSNPTVNIELTDSAILQLLERTEGKGVSEIRLGITGGGCGGYEYIFDYNTTNDPSDQVIDFGKFTIHIDNISRPYLNNLVLDYVKKGINEEFTFENPNVQATCGCGVSMTF
mgnify:CR=1 FL=1